MKQLIILLGLLLASSSLTRAQADCTETPPSGMAPLAAYSLFYENYRNGDYEFALKYGRWMSCAKPETIQGYPKFNLKTQYERLITIYDEVGKLQADPAERAAYIDTALTLFDESYELFGEDTKSQFDITLQKGRFFQENYDFVDDGLSKAYAEYAKLFELDAQRAVSLGDGYYLRLALNNLVRKNQKEEAQNLIDTVKPLADGSTLEFVEKQQREILGSPEEQIAYFEPILENDPENIQALESLKDAYGQTGDRAKLKDVMLKLHELDPTYESAMSIAEMEESNANYSEAAKYYTEALNKAENDDQKKKIYLELADANVSLGKLSEAKANAQDALAIDSNYGMAYIKIAQIYAQAVTQCTQDRKLEAQDKVVYWAVIDYLNKAKSVDSSVSSNANRLLSTYEPVTPSAEDKFFTLGYEKGQKVKVDGSLMPCYSWINETVTVQ